VTFGRVWAGVGFAITAVACGGPATDPGRPPAQQPPPAVTVASAAAPPEPPPPPAPGSDKDHPVLRCGPADSYRWVANHRCGDGSVPLAGNPRAAKEARLWNVGPNKAGRIVDHYVVPCPEGEVHLYVDMSECPAPPSSADA